MEEQLPSRKNENLSSVWMSIAERIGKHQQRRRAETTTFLLDPKPNDLILDVGCGNGFVAKYFLGPAWHVAGLDISTELLKNAKFRLGRENVSLVAADATKLPFRSLCFDRVVLLEVLEHLPNPRLCTKEVDRCAKKNCEVIVSVPYKEKHTTQSYILSRHLHSFDESIIKSLFPKGYKLVVKKHLVNILMSLPFFKCLPLKIWLALNDILGCFLGGYWAVFRFQKLS